MSMDGKIFIMKIDRYIFEMYIMGRYSIWIWIGRHSIRMVVLEIS